MPKCLHLHNVTFGLARHFVNMLAVATAGGWLKLIDYLHYWMTMRSLEEKAAFCSYTKVQKDPDPCYALKSSQRDESFKKIYFQDKKYDF